MCFIRREVPVLRHIRDAETKRRSPSRRSLVAEPSLIYMLFRVRNLPSTPFFLRFRVTFFAPTVTLPISRRSLQVSRRSFLVTNKAGKNRLGASSSFSLLHSLGFLKETIRKEEEYCFLCIVFFFLYLFLFWFFFLFVFFLHETFFALSYVLAKALRLMSWCKITKLTFSYVSVNELCEVE